MTHATTAEHLFSAFNLLLCIAIAGVCLCRLRLTDLHTRVGVRVKYSGIGGAALVFGLSPWVGEWPGWTGCAFSAAVLVGLLSSSSRWSGQAPIETHSDYAPLEEKP